MAKVACCWLVVMSGFPVGSWIGPLHSGTLKQRVEAAGALQSGQVIEATDVDVPDIDLRNRTAPGPVHHFDAAVGLEIDPDLFDVGHASPVEQLFGPVAKGTDGGAIHADLGHRLNVRVTFS